MNMHRSDDPQAGSARLNVSLRSAGLKAARGRLGGLRQSPWTSTRMPRLNPYLRLELESTIRIQADPGGPQRTTYRAAVNRKVVGSSPTSGATLLNTIPAVQADRAGGFWAEDSNRCWTSASYPHDELLPVAGSVISGPSFFADIREWDGSKDRAFEELCFQILREPDDLPDNSVAIRTGNPDGAAQPPCR